MTTDPTAQRPYNILAIIGFVISLLGFNIVAIIAFFSFTAAATGGA